MSALASVLSDATILELVENGRIRIDPWDPGLVQPASVDLRLGDSFRVFHNHRASAIDLREPPAGLTEEVVINDDESFVIHPGEFCLGRTLEWVELPDDIVARIEGKSQHRPPRADRPRHRRLLRPRLEGHADARAQQPHAHPDQAVPRPADRPAVVHGARPAGARPYGSPELGSHYQGQRAATESRYEGARAARADPEPASSRLAAVTTLIIAAGEPSKVPFYIAGGLLVVWALGLAAVGLTRPASRTASAARAA